MNEGRDKVTRRIQLSSWAWAIRTRPAVMVVHVYPDVPTMHAAARRFNGYTPHDAVGVCQITYGYRNEHGTPRDVRPHVRLVEGHLGIRVVSHEVHHAAAALYGDSLSPGTPAHDVLTHHNEPFAHLYDELLGKLVDRLYALGYYEKDNAA